MKSLKITIGGTILTASLIKSNTTNDFMKLLPLDLDMNDLFNREKYGALPESLSPISAIGRHATTLLFITGMTEKTFQAPELLSLEKYNQICRLLMIRAWPK